MAGTISSVTSGDAWRPAAWALEIPSAIVGRSSSPAVPLFNSKVAVSRGFTQPRVSAPFPAATARSRSPRRPRTRRTRKIEAGVMVPLSGPPTARPDARQTTHYERPARASRTHRPGRPRRPDRQSRYAVCRAPRPGRPARRRRPVCRRNRMAARRPGGQCGDGRGPPGARHTGAGRGSRPGAHPARGTDVGGLLRDRRSRPARPPREIRRSGRQLRSGAPGRAQSGGPTHSRAPAGQIRSRDKRIAAPQ